MDWDSPSARPLLPLVVALRETLFQHERLLVPSLFAAFWKQFASALDQHLLAHLLRAQRFSTSAAAQLRSHLLGAILPLFSLYTHSPELHMPQTQEGCLLLTLDTAVAAEVLQVLEEAVGTSSVSAVAVRDLNVAGDRTVSREESSDRPRPRARDPIALLAQNGVHQMDMQQAIAILRQRVSPGQLFLKLSSTRDWF